MAQQEPLPPEPTQPKVIWQQGNSRLLQYGNTNDPTVLLIPSLINGYKILDISAERSVLRFLTAQGFNPLIMDWGCVGETERQFDMADYQQRLAEAWACCRADYVIGYCMGGIFAKKLALDQPVQKLILVATPDDFTAMATAAERQRLKAAWPWLQQIIARNRQLPADILQYMLVARSPEQVAVRYQTFYRQYADSSVSERQHFALIDRWLSEARSLAGPVATQAIKQWYLAGQFVSPPVEVDTLLVTGTYDKVVPYDASTLIKDQSNVRHFEVNAGHLGLVAGRHSLRNIWLTVAQFISPVA